MRPPPPCSAEVPGKAGRHAVGPAADAGAPSYPAPMASTTPPRPARHPVPPRRLAAALCLGLLVLASPLAGVPTGTAHPVAQAPSVPSPTPSAGWDERGDMVMGAQDALTALDTLPADNPAATSWGEGGRLSWFGQSWEDVDGDGCDTRNEILARDLTSPDFSRSQGIQDRSQGAGQGAAGCPNATVWSGTLHDPYTGRDISFRRGQDTSGAVQIDHVIPLNYLYAHGAWAWDQRTRLLVANDPLNLLAVDGPANNAKGACGPATCPAGSTERGNWNPAKGGGWWPPNDAYRCQYAQRFVTVAATYQLGLPEADRKSLRSALSDCAAGGDGAPFPGHQIQQLVEAVLGDSWISALTAAGLSALGVGLIVRVRRRLGPGGGGRR